MKLRTRIAASAATVGLIGGLGVVASTASSAGTTTIDVTHDHVTCGTLGGKIGFSTPLTLTGPTSGSNNITVVAAVEGCSDDDNSNVGVFSGKIKATLTSNSGSSCVALLGPSTISGSATVTWKAAKGQKFSAPSSTISFTQVNGGTFATGTGSWSSTYGLFSIGSSYGTAPLTTSGDFAGTDGGVSGWFAGTTQEDVNWLGALCGGAGIKKLNFGNGGVHLG